MSPPTVAGRSDGVQARDRLLQAALRLFAAKGFERTSIRDIASAAGANVSAVGYYFSDKAGLYRAAFFEPIGEQCQASLPEPGSVPLPVMMHGFFRAFLQPLKQGESVQQVMRLHFREIVEPTGLWTELIETEIRPQHEALLRVLVAEFGLRQADVELQRLTFSIIGMAIHFFVAQDIVQAIAPEVMDGPEAIDALAQQLANGSLAMIEAERQRRATLPRPERRGAR